MKICSFGLVAEHQAKGWDDIAKCMPARSARQCRDRYNNYLLDPLLVSPRTPEEEAIILSSYREFGPK
jgi:hypothetical protein